MADDEGDVRSTRQRIVCINFVFAVCHESSLLLDPQVAAAASRADAATSLDVTWGADWLALSVIITTGAEVCLDVGRALGGGPRGARERQLRCPPREVRRAPVAGAAMNLPKLVYTNPFFL